MGPISEEVDLAIPSIREPGVACAKFEVGGGKQADRIAAGNLCRICAEFEIRRAFGSALAIFELVLHEDLMRAYPLKRIAALGERWEEPSRGAGGRRIVFRADLLMDLVADRYAIRATIYLFDPPGLSLDQAIGFVGEEQSVPSWYCNAARMVEIHDDGPRIPSNPSLGIEGPSVLPPALETDDPFPAVLHLTHQKAGSQWILAILRHLFPDRLVPPQPDHGNVFAWGIRSGRVYPTIYFSRGELFRLPLPSNRRIFFVMRDLRDTLVSMYFSFRGSHPTQIRDMAKLHAALNALPFEDGMLLLMETWLSRVAMVQLSWLEGECRVLRYEEILADTFSQLRSLLVDYCGIDVAPERLKEAVLQYEFERYTGRKPGVEDPHSHYRKGIAGDWKNHVSPLLKERIKRRFNSVLVATGYESDDRW